MTTNNSTQRYDIIHILTQNVSKEISIEPKLIVAHCIGLPLLDVIEGLTLSSPKDGEKTKGLGVSAHYFIPQISGAEFMSEMITAGLSLNTQHLTFPNQPPVICFAQENQRTLHAGHSHWGQFNEIPGCEVGLNSCSIGIEFHAPGYGKDVTGNQDWFTFIPYSELQIEVGVLLMKDIIVRWKINPKNVLAHSDISPYLCSAGETPGRIKTDPGALFPWPYLAEKGLGFYPPSTPLRNAFKQMSQQEKENNIRTHLHAIGYNILTDASLPWGVTEKYIVNAYKMHYMQKEYSICHPDSHDFGQIDEALMMSLESWQEAT